MAESTRAEFQVATSRISFHYIPQYLVEVKADDGQHVKEPQLVAYHTGATPILMS
jgi:hypothetical protein